VKGFYVGGLSVRSVCGLAWEVYVSCVSGFPCRVVGVITPGIVAAVIAQNF
jgi:hypothetical protein